MLEWLPEPAALAADPSCTIENYTKWFEWCQLENDQDACYKYAWCHAKLNGEPLPTPPASQAAPAPTTAHLTPTGAQAYAQAAQQAPQIPEADLKKESSAEEPSSGRIVWWVVGLGVVGGAAWLVFR